MGVLPEILLSHEYGQEPDLARLPIVSSKFISNLPTSRLKLHILCILLFHWPYGRYMYNNGTTLLDMNMEKSRLHDMSTCVCLLYLVFI